MGQLHIKCFGMIAEVVGATYILENFDGGDAELLKSNLCEKFPKLSQLTFSIAVNRVISSDHTSISQNDEIALLPPFSGG
jgi:molybdopterin converting factor small subunit